MELAGNGADGADGAGIRRGCRISLGLSGYGMAIHLLLLLNRLVHGGPSRPPDCFIISLLGFVSNTHIVPSYVFMSILYITCIYTLYTPELRTGSCRFRLGKGAGPL